ncbi:MAG: hypothetical protein MN733_09505, partial [Nitrososphaera sp.]|nr:hypothetical protein [Nitrososphaera sp.]
DYSRHMDYVHFNPVKHGYVSVVAQWPHSTFHRWVKAGAYPHDWGGEGALDIVAGERGRESGAVSFGGTPLRGFRPTRADALITSHAFSNAE